MNRSLIAAPVAIAIATFFVGGTVAPAVAAPAVEACEAMPEQIRISATSNADAKAVKRALKLTKVGEVLCDAGNERAGKRKFKAAFKALGTTAEEYAQNTAQ